MYKILVLIFFGTVLSNLSAQTNVEEQDEHDIQMPFFSVDSVYALPQEEIMDWRLHFTLANAIPQHDFQDNYNSSAIGFNFGLGYNFAPAPVGLGLDFNMLYFDTYDPQFHNSDRYEAANRIYSFIVPLRFSPRLRVTDNFAISPYFEVLGAWQIFDSRLQYSENRFDQNFDTTIDSEMSNAFGWGYGVGYTIELISGKSGTNGGRLNLETSLRWISGNEVTYYKVNVLDTRTGFSEFNEFKSKTDMITFHIGVSVEFN